MMNKIIAVGTTTQNNKWVNGQSMMFQLFVDHLPQHRIKPVIVDFGLSISKNSNQTRVSGKASLVKVLDNITVVAKFVKALALHPKAPVYINTSQTSVGFMRDFVLINLASRAGRKIIAHQFGANYEQYYSEQTPARQKLINKTLLKTARVIVEGDFTKEQFSFLPGYEDKVAIVPNGLPEKIDSSSILPKQISAKEPVEMFYISNMIESKGFWDVLKAFEILVDERKRNVKIAFSGKFYGATEDKTYQTPEDAKKAFLDRTEKYRKSGLLTYHANGLYGSDKAEAFIKANFFLLPSYYINEGQPASVLEALAYGCVPITTRYRVIPMMVNEQNGAFVNPQSPIEIADAVEMFMDNPQKYQQHSEAAIRDYKEKFTAERYIEKLLTYF
ncbi:glycosyltransferase family 4 protein [Kaistella pullorum]|uniref:Glycosyltransferase family 4 protein n=1 Tax=Kaistella pullorum TaxID=2763074 RepID=A0ABR8WPY7_9FLAO|nr:glycosyltransferase family 4 protein [Kaistella pullorum]MBD8018756.1 glycosyltransferase family 4 protein [Kaistella pullorum]